MSEIITEQPASWQLKKTGQIEDCRDVWYFKTTYQGLDILQSSIHSAFQKWKKIRPINITVYLHW